MSRPDWYAQPFRADGGITADGLLDQLGRPSLSRLTLLVREAAQNSWDARLPDQVLIRFRLDLGTVPAGNIAAWRRLISSQAEGDGDEDPMVRRLSRAPAIRYLSISDRGTKGLAGPTRSDSGPDDRREWLRFVLNSGDRDGSGGRPTGGTFGYGKGAFFRLSKVGCVLVHTRFIDRDGSLRSRFIGVVIRKAFWSGGLRYTGRRWWGLPETEHCEPLRDEQADAITRSLGIPGFRGDETGTTLIVVDPDLTDPALPDTESSEELTIAEAGNYLADAAAWNLWPITLPHRSARMTLAVTANGADVPVPGPEDDATLAYFADAYRRALGDASETLSCGNPRKELGRFAYQFTYGATVTSPAARELGLEGAPHHICLLRSPDLVVRYHSGPQRSNPEAGYAGVFRVVEDLDETFSRAEPPSHDAWEYQQLKGREATFVRTAARRLKERCDALSGSQARRAVKVGGYAMGPVAQRLGHLLAGPGGTGAAIVDPSPRAGTSRILPPTGDGAPSVPTDLGGTARTNTSSPPETATGTANTPTHRPTRRPTLVDSPRFDVIDGRPVVLQHVRLHGPDRVEGSVKVLTGDGGAESVSPAGAAVPEVYGWQTADGDIVAGEVFYNPEGPTEVDLIVTAVADVLIDIHVAGRG